MHHIKTQAIKITEETYSIAVACLPGGFAMIPFANVENHWLIINTVTTVYIEDLNQDIATIENQWLNDEDFQARFNEINKKAGRPAQNAWIEVERSYDEPLTRAPRRTLQYQNLSSRSRRRRPSGYEGD